MGGKSSFSFHPHPTPWKHHHSAANTKTLKAASYVTSSKSQAFSIPTAGNWFVNFTVRNWPENLSFIKLHGTPEVTQ